LDGSVLARIAGSAKQARGAEILERRTIRKLA
jgi:hypothetical protein